MDDKLELDAMRKDMDEFEQITLDLAYEMNGIEEARKCHKACVETKAWLVNFEKENPDHPWFKKRYLGGHTITKPIKINGQE